MRGPIYATVGRVVMIGFSFRKSGLYRFASCGYMYMLRVLPMTLLDHESSLPGTGGSTGVVLSEVLCKK